MSIERSRVALADALWDARDVARYLKASRSWVYQRAETGLLPSLRVGGLLRFEPEVVRAWARGASAGAAALPVRADAP
jgi:excisionase family DNA binding protein